MVLKHGLIVVPDRFEVFDVDEEGVGDTGVTHVAEEAWDEASHEVEVAEVGHHWFVADEVVEAVGDEDGVLGVVVDGFGVEGLLDGGEEGGEVGVGDAEFFEEAGVAEDSEAEVSEGVFF